ETGLALADSLIAGHLADEGEYPRCVGLTVWGTSAMRTQGDDIAEVLALIGCRPRWDDAIGAVARLGEPTESNYLRAHALADQARHGDWRRATTRIFGSKPGAYGAGLLPLIDARNWRDD